MKLYLTLMIVVASFMQSFSQERVYRVEGYTNGSEFVPHRFQLQLSNQPQRSPLRMMGNFSDKFDNFFLVYDTEKINSMFSATNQSVIFPEISYSNH